MTNKSSSLSPTLDVTIWSHFVVLLKSDLDAQQTDHSSCFSPTLGVTICTRFTVMNLVTLCCAINWYLDVQQTHLRFVEQKLMLISNFLCDKIHKIHCYKFGHTLLCYLSQTWMFNKLYRFDEQKLLLISNFRCDNMHKIHYNEFGHTVVQKSQTWMLNKSTSEAGSLKKSSCLAPALGVTKFTAARDLILVTLCCAT